MKFLWLASMLWPHGEAPICVGTNKKKTQRLALSMLKEEHGTGPVTRHGALCSVPLQYDDIEMTKIPFMDTSKKDK